MQVYGWNELCSKVTNISWADCSYIKGNQLKWWLSQIKNHFCILYVTELNSKIGERNARIVDAFAILHSIKGSWKTFSDFANSTFALLMRFACESKAARLDFVADRYPEISIKNTQKVY